MYLTTEKIFKILALCVKLLKIFSMVVVYRPWLFRKILNSSLGRCGVIRTERTSLTGKNISQVSVAWVLDKKEIH